MNSFSQSVKDFSDFMWGYPLLILLISGGLFFLIYSEFIPFRYIRHAIRILKGDFDEEEGEGQIRHYEALSTALAGTVGLGNISGVAVAIVSGGPGAIFWMWVSALLGVSTKFFTCTLSIMFRGKDSEGQIQGGPMYVIQEGLGKNWKPLAILFSLVGMIGVSPLFQANQLTKIVTDILSPQQSSSVEGININAIIIGVVISIIVGIVIYGGIERIGKVTGALVPIMAAIYILAVLFIIFSNHEHILSSFQLIFEDAFSGNAVLGGAVGQLIITGARRAAFSNEAGIGTAPMAHGAARTDQPVREGMVAMLGPIIDTLIICTMTALAIIITGVWKNSETNGVTLTLEAFEQGIPYIGKYVLLICVITFSLSTLFSFPYYGAKCLSYLIGAHRKHWYYYAFLVMIVIGSVASLNVLVNLIDSMYAIMAFPTMLSALLLAPAVKKELRRYTQQLKKK